MQSRKILGMFLLTLSIGVGLSLAPEKAYAEGPIKVGLPCNLKAGNTITSINANRLHDHADPDTAVDLQENDECHNNEVIAAISGTIVKYTRDDSAWCKDKLGNNIPGVTYPAINTVMEITGSNGIKVYYYHHNTDYTATVNDGYVNAGEKLASIGSIGCSTGPHIHFEVLKDNVRQGYSQWEFIDLSKPVVLPTVPCLPNNECPVYRFFDNTGKRHLFTTSTSEKAVIEGQSGWIAEGLGFNAYTTQVTGSTPVYRFRNSTTNAYLLTTNLADGQGQVNEGVAFYAFAGSATGRTPVYRFYNAATTDYHYTTDTVERNQLQNTAGWTYQGVKFYVKLANTCSTNTCAIFRLYHQAQGRHLLTTTYSEAQSMLNSDRNWKFESVPFFGLTTSSSLSGSALLYRLRNNTNHSYVYTTSTNERDLFVAAGWTSEGASFKVYTSSGATRTPVFKVYNSAENKYMFTSSDSEANDLQNTGNWVRQGTAFYAPTSDQTPNSAPTINSAAITSVYSSKSYTYQVQATDSNGDAITYSLGIKPTGMTISTSGLVSWATPVVGSYTVQVVVTDSKGASATQTYTLQVKNAFTEVYRDQHVSGAQLLIIPGSERNGLPTGSTAWTKAASPLFNASVYDTSAGGCVVTSTVPVYRLRNSTSGNYIFTSHDGEKNTILSSGGHTLETTTFCVSASSNSGTGFTQGLHRFYYAPTGMHKYTKTTSEYSGQSGMSYEGLKFYVK